MFGCYRRDAEEGWVSSSPEEADALIYGCACGSAHALPVSGRAVLYFDTERPPYSWNRDPEEPTVEEEVEERSGDGRLCIHRIEGGFQKFSLGCEHRFAGKEVRL